MKHSNSPRQQKSCTWMARCAVTIAAILSLGGAAFDAAQAQKDSRGWDGTSSSMYNNNNNYSGGSSSFGAYSGPSHGLATPFGRMPSGNTTGNPGYTQGRGESSNSGSGGSYYDSLPLGKNAGVPVGNPNGRGFTPPANLSFQEQQVRNKQREQGLAQQRAAQPVNSSITQSQRWENEWRQQHPGEPMPNAGQLQKMHISELQNNVNTGWSQYRQRAASKREEEYQLATLLSKKNAAREGRTWSKSEFDREYDQSHRDQAQAYLNSVMMSRENSDRRAEMRRADAIGGR